MSEYFRKPIVKILMLKGQEGQSIKEITKTGTSGLVDTYTITLTDGTTSTFTVTNGKEISNISKTGTSGLVDTYTIKFNDGTESTFTVTNGDSDYKPAVFLAPLTQMSRFGSSCCLGLSKDGLCFNPIPGTENFCDNNNDIQVFEYKGHYLFACTTSSTSEDNNIDLYAGWTDDFETYHFENIYLGFSQYRDSEYPDGLHHIARWTPRFYIDKDGNLNILVSMAYNSATSKDIYEIQSRNGYFAIFHQTVEFKAIETGFLTGKGDISKFNIKQDGVAVSTFFDGEMIYNNGVYYLLYKDGYFNDVCVATSTDDYGEFTTTKKNIFEALSSEAPCVVKYQNGWLVYGQQYASDVTWQPRNLLLYTEDFDYFKAIGFPKRNLSNIRKDGAMRNLSPIQISGEIASKLDEKCGVLNEGGYNNGEIQSYYYQSKILDCVELAYNNGRAISPFENSWFAAKSVDPLHMNNLWNASTIYFFGSSTQQIFNINYSIGTKKDRAVLCGDYTTCAVALANADDTQSISRRINRGNIDNFFINKNITFNKSSGINGEVHIFNTLIATMIIKNVSSANTWSAGEVVGTLPVYPYENNSVIFGMITATSNPDLPVGTTVPFYLKNDGTLVAVNDTPPQHWTVNTTFQMRADFYKTLI